MLKPLKQKKNHVEAEEEEEQEEDVEEEEVEKTKKHLQQDSDKAGGHMQQS